MAVGLGVLLGMKGLMCITVCLGFDTIWTKCWLQVATRLDAWLVTVSDPVQVDSIILGTSGLYSGACAGHAKSWSAN